MPECLGCDELIELLCSDPVSDASAQSHLETCNRCRARFKELEEMMEMAADYEAFSGGKFEAVAEFRVEQILNALKTDATESEPASSFPAAVPDDQSVAQPTSDRHNNATPLVSPQPKARRRQHELWLSGVVGAVAASLLILVALQMGKRSGLIQRGGETPLQAGIELWAGREANADDGLVPRPRAGDTGCLVLASNVPAQALVIRVNESGAELLTTWELLKAGKPRLINVSAPPTRIDRELFVALIVSGNHAPSASVREAFEAAVKEQKVDILAASQLAAQKRHANEIESAVRQSTNAVELRVDLKGWEIRRN